MRRAASIVLMLVAVALVAFPVTIAAAVGPSNVPVVAKVYTFEPSGLSADSISMTLGSSPENRTYWWGRTSAAAHTGSWALWCAGSGAAWPSWSGWTRGNANFTLPDTSNWYQSDFSYWYIYPSKTVDSTFVLRWFGSPKDPTTDVADSQISTLTPPGVTSTWTQVSVHRTGGTDGQQPMASGAGSVQFSFDNIFGAGSAAGPTIDDVTLSGWKYGPARSVAAVRAASPATTVNVSWLAPYSAPAPNTTPDARTIDYHVWRYDFSTATSTDVGTVQTPGVAFSDTSAPADHVLRYTVQAVDPSNASYLGQPSNAASDVGVPGATTGFISGTVTNSSNALLPNINVKVDSLAAVPTNASGAYSVSNLSPGSHTVVFSGSGYVTQTKSGINVTAGNSTSCNAVMVSSPATTIPVYRFRNLKNGFYLWTASEAEKNNIVATLSKTWVLEGVAYQINTATNTSPLWRFRNLKGGFYLYTADSSEKNNIVATLSKTWTLEGVAYNVSTNPTGSQPVWRFRNNKNGTYLYSADVNEKNHIVATLSSTWTLEGPAFYIAP